MKTKEEIAQTFLTRYTGKALNHFGKYIILTNFNSHLKYFASLFDISIQFDGNAPMTTCTNNESITMINFGIGSSVAATIMDLLAILNPEFVLFIGKCGGLKRNMNIGDYFIPIAAIRGEGTSNDYFPPEFPALPYLPGQKIIAEVMSYRNIPFYSGTIYTTNRRIWEHDEMFLQYLQKLRICGLDMELATLLTVGCYNSIPTSVLLNISDLPIKGEIKNETSDFIEEKEKLIEFTVDIALESMRLAKKRKIVDFMVDEDFGDDTYYLKNHV